MEQNGYKETVQSRKIKRIKMTFYQLKHPFTKLITGPTQSGKSFFIERLLNNLSYMMDYPPEEIIFCFGEWQSAYERLNKNIQNIRFIEGLPNEEILLTNGSRKLIIIDDLMQETDERVTKIFTKGSHHRNLSVIYIVQNLFSKNKEHRTITLNCHYFVIFKNPRDISQVVRLASQMYPKNTRFMLDAYKMATTEPHSYLFLDFKQDTPDQLRLRSHIFPSETNYVYIQK